MRVDPWRIVGISAVIVLLVVYLVWWMRMINDPVERSSADFMALYAAGRVAQTHGFSAIYDIKLQQEIQQEVVGFQLLATALSFRRSYWFWTAPRLVRFASSPFVVEISFANVYETSRYKP